MQTWKKYQDKPLYIFADENKSIDVRINLCILDYYIK